MKYKTLYAPAAALWLMLIVANVMAQSKTPGNNLKNDSIAKVAKAKKQLWLGMDVEPQFDDVIKPAGDNTGSWRYLATGGLRVGFNLCYDAGRTAGFETGLRYGFWETKTNTGAFAGHVNAKYNSGEIPVLVNLHTHGNKLRFFSSTGFAVGDVFLENVDFGYGRGPGFDPVIREPVDRDFVVSTVYATLIARAGLELDATSNVRIKVGAAFNVTSVLYSNNNNGFLPPFNVAGLPYSVGLNVAFLFRVKKRNEKPDTGTRPTQPDSRKFKFLIDR